MFSISIARPSAHVFAPISVRFALTVRTPWTQSKNHHRPNTDFHFCGRLLGMRAPSKSRAQFGGCRHSHRSSRSNGIDQFCRSCGYGAFCLFAPAQTQSHPRILGRMQHISYSRKTRSVLLLSLISLEMHLASFTNLM